MQRKDGTQWVDLHEVSLNEKILGRTSFQQFLEIPRLNTELLKELEIRIEYRVTPSPTYSQESFTSSNLDSAGITITNRLLTTDFSFKKVMEN